jgi:putative NADPH-quinone reductase
MESEAMRKNVLIVYARPEPTSLNRQLVEVAVQTLQQQGHEVLLSELYGMHWKAVFDEHDFPSRADPQRLSFVTQVTSLSPKADCRPCRGDANCASITWNWSVMQ